MRTLEHRNKSFNLAERNSLKRIFFNLYRVIILTVLRISKNINFVSNIHLTASYAIFKQYYGN